jgi:predicted NAD/FAD-binding protein
MRIAIIGTGIAGLTCAHLLSQRHDVTVFERDERPGGHSNTVRVDLEEESHDVDTGFIVYNERNYPGLVRLFERLRVPTKPSDMSFSVSDAVTGIEWRATSPNTAFAQRRNVLRPAFLRMLGDIIRFNHRTRRLLREDGLGGLTLRELAGEGRWSSRMVDWYLAPIVSAIWSAPVEAALDIPAATFARFFDNHGLLRLGDQPSWRTVEGGARVYVERIVAPLGRRVRLATPVAKVIRRHDGVELLTDSDGPLHFDHVVLATHSDESLALLGDATPAERSVLGAIRYQPNTAVLHTDERLLPRCRRAWASWNYRLERAEARPQGATVTYHMNRLQSIDSRHQLCVTLNPLTPIEGRAVLGTFAYAHPVLDSGAVAAQRRHCEISGVRSTSYCGAYWGYGFHEDGVQSALRVCRALGVDW